jgi:hypothetical protein
VIFTTVLATAAAGCGSISSNNPDAATGTTPAAACAALANAECGKRMTCSNGANITRAFGDMNTCIARETLSCMGALAAPGTGNNVSLTMQCVAAFATLACNDFFDGKIPSVCAPSGPRAAGQPCAFNAQCASAFCGRVKNSLCGTCADAPTDGTSCQSSGCGHGQTCVDATQTCVAYGALNASCDGGHPCGNGLSCVGAMASTSTPGACHLAVGELGAACGGTMPGCDATLGLFCGGAAGAKTCMTTPYEDDGAACGTRTSTSFAACKSGGCYTDTGVAGSGDMGTCKADGIEGAPCDSLLGPACLTPARCVPTTSGGTAGICTLPNGASCG